MVNLTTKLNRWHKKYGRHNLPWQQKGPYETWISEVMLQQTQVGVVIPYFKKFLESFPTVEALANASQDDVLAHWAGLGYYSRARNLHHTARRIKTEFQGNFPVDLSTLVSLPGIGRSTAGAILSLSLNQRGVIQDGNVRRVLARLFLVEGDLTKTKQQKILWELADQLTPLEPALAKIHTQAMMDLGALLCKRRNPMCETCPFTTECQALQNSRVDELPQPKKIKSQNAQLWIVLQLIETSGRTLFIRRPDEEIWGGLYTPLIGKSLLDLSQKYQIPEATKGKFQRSIKHTFSHFKVSLDHYILRIKTANQIAIGEWADIKVFQKGVPTPIRKLIEQME